MEDSRQIENLIYRYAELIDSGDLEGVAELFRDGEITSSVQNSRRTGYAQILQMYQASCRVYKETGTPLTKHLTTNVIVEIAANSTTANARSYYTVIQATDSLPLQPIISGRYHDCFHKAEGKWVFASREMFVDLLGDLSAHLLYDASGLQ